MSRPSPGDKITTPVLQDEHGEAWLRSECGRYLVHITSRPPRRIPVSTVRRATVDASSKRS